MSPDSLTTASGGFDPRFLRDVYGCFPSGVAAVCALVDGTPMGMTVSSFTAVSLDSPLVSVRVDNGSTTWPRLRTVEHIGVSILAKSHARVCRQLAARTENRFEDLSFFATPQGTLLIDGASAWLDCTIES